MAKDPHIPPINLSNVIIPVTILTDPLRMTEGPEFELLQTGTLIDFEVTNKEIQLALDGENVFVKVELQFKPEEDDEEVEDLVEWGAFGFIFALMKFLSSRHGFGS